MHSVYSVHCLNITISYVDRSFVFIYVSLQKVSSAKINKSFLQLPRIQKNGIRPNTLFFRVSFSIFFSQQISFKKETVLIKNFFFLSFNQNHHIFMCVKCIYTCFVGAWEAAVSWLITSGVYHKIQPGSKCRGIQDLFFEWRKRTSWKLPNIIVYD